MAQQSDQLKDILQQHQTLVVVGANWGDEGKGKVIDLVMEHYDVVARFSGGANAGHTVFTPKGQKIVSHLIPCGLAQQKICVLGRGEFFNLELFLKELDEAKTILGENNLAPIYIDQQAPLWTPYHRLFEIYIEYARGERKIGTTNKGIGPLEGIYKLRLAPLVGYLLNQELLKKSLEALYNVLEPCFEKLRAEGFLESEIIPTPQEVLNQLTASSEKVKDFLVDASFLMQQQLTEGKRILFEGAQASGLDAWWGTYPFVSSGNSVGAGAALGTGLPMANFPATILVAKTLPTRVGFGPFPSEMWDRQAAMDFAKNNGELFTAGAARDEFLSKGLASINSGRADNTELAKYFQVLGDERGATTGRGRSLGFLDIPWLQYAIRINGPKFLALTRFDMLSGVKSIPVVVGYKYKGELLAPGKLPPMWDLGLVETVKESWPCFTESIFGINEETNLPKAAQDFLKKLESLLKVPIVLVGTGPSRQHIVLRAG